MTYPMAGDLTLATAATPMGGIGIWPATIPPARRRRRRAFICR